MRNLGSQLGVKKTLWNRNSVYICIWIRIASLPTTIYPRIVADTKRSSCPGLPLSNYYEASHYCGSKESEDRTTYRQKSERDEGKSVQRWLRVTLVSPTSWNSLGFAWEGEIYHKLYTKQKNLFFYFFLKLWIFCSTVGLAVLEWCENRVYQVPKIIFNDKAWTAFRRKKK